MISRYNRIIVFCAVMALSACGSVEKIRYAARSEPAPATILVDGQKVCDQTPCDFQIDANLVFVGLAYAPDGYECVGSNIVEAVPIESRSTLYPQRQSVSACLDRLEPPRLLSFDLTLKNEVPLAIPRAAPKKIRFGGFGYKANKWQNREDEKLNASAGDINLFYGQETASDPATLVFGEIRAGKQTPFGESQYDLGAFLQVHFKQMAMFYLIGGLTYRKMNNDFMTDGVFPYFGGGILLNQKTIVEMWSIFKGPFVQREDFSYKLGEFGYDFYVEPGFYAHSRNRTWGYQSVQVGLRFYF